MVDIVCVETIKFFYKFDYIMAKQFNTKLWNIGRQIEDELKPKIDDFFGCSFERSDNVFDVLDFHDENNKKIVEVKGRRCPSSQYPTTIITCGKITEGLMRMEQDAELEVYYFFVFTDKTLYFKLDPQNCDFDMKRTGTAHIPHYLIPIKDLIEFEPI